MRSLRGRLLVLVALAAYLAVNVPVRALHHHAAVSASAAVPATPSQCAPADADGDSDHVCPICSVLYLAQVHPSAVQVIAVSARAESAVIAAARARPHCLETATHSRAPPIVASPV
jgi:hypothetical protein